MPSWDHNEPWRDDVEPYWQQDARNERDDYDQHLRRLEEAEQDRLTRDAGENRGSE